MSDTIKNSLKESIPLINNIYTNLLNELNEKFKYHDELYGPLQTDLKISTENIPINQYYVIDIITENFLFCLEQIIDKNSDYFIYQKEKITKKNKVYKNKLPKIGIRTLLKKLLTDADSKLTNRIFKDILDIFNLLIFKDSDNNYQFNEEYITYVKDNKSDHKNFSKMLMVFDNINNLMNVEIDEVFIEDDDDDEKEEFKNKSSKKSKKNKKKEKSPFGFNPDFMKNLENTKIAQLAKNISEKIKIDDFPDLTDPSKLLSAFTNSENSESGGIGNLLKFVVGEVEGAFKDGNMNEKDLLGEAQNLMGQFQNMSGFDPMSMLNNPNFDVNQFANIFDGLKK